MLPSLRYGSRQLRIWAFLSLIYSSGLFLFSARLNCLCSQTCPLLANPSLLCMCCFQSSLIWESSQRNLLGSLSGKERSRFCLSHGSLSYRLKCMMRDEWTRGVLCGCDSLLISGSLVIFWDLDGTTCQMNKCQVVRRIFCSTHSIFHDSGWL